MLYWIQYKHLLKCKAGCFWRFWYVYTINWVHGVPSWSTLWFWSIFNKRKLQKWLFFFGTKIKAKHVFTKNMLLNEIQAFFVSLCFFALTFFKSNSITFRFSLSLTWRLTNYQTIKFLRLYLQNSKRNKK